MSAMDAELSDAPTQERDTFVIHALLQRLGSKNTYNEVKEAVSASPREATIDWASDAISGFGFICNSGLAKLSEISAGLCPALLGVVPYAGIDMTVYQVSVIPYYFFYF